VDKIPVFGLAIGRLGQVAPLLATRPQTISSGKQKFMLQLFARHCGCGAMPGGRQSGAIKASQVGRGAAGEFFYFNRP
jgi:hypothetical protein